MAFRKLFFKRVQGIRDNYLLQEGDIALDESDFKLYRGDGETVGGVVISGAGGGGGGIALSDISVTQASASGAGTLAYNSSTGVFTYTPPTASGLGAKTSVSEADVTQHQSALSITESQISDFGTYLTSVAFADITSKPTTIAGYGITDAFDGAFGSLSGTPTTLAGYGITDAATLNNMAPTGAVDFTGATSVDFTGATITGTSFLTSYTETDPVVGAITGIVKADGAGNISAAVAGTDYSTFDGAYGSLTGTPTIPSALTDLGISDGTNGQVLTTDGSGSFTFEDSSGGGGSSLQSRTTKAGTTGSLADAAEENLDITGFKGYALLKVQTDRAARVRIYTDAASRTADASRAEGSDPAADDGVIAEVITTAAETVLISPGAFGFNNESTPTTTIPCRVTNKSGGASTVTVTLHVLQLES